MIALCPGRFSTITCWPRPFAISSATARATMSWLPPGTSGTIRRTGLAGKVCATAADAAKQRTARPSFSIGILETSWFELLDLARAARALGEQEGEVVPGRDVARAEPDELLDEIGPRPEAADADVPAVSAACGDGALVGLGKPGMVILPRKAEIGAQIIAADQHHVDAFDGDALLCHLERSRRLELHRDEGRLVHRRQRVGRGHAAVSELRQPGRETAAA